jgi:hypothetical protein
MTAQFGDQIFFQGDWHTLFTNPLEDLFRQGFPRPYSMLGGEGIITANWRGYVASWEVRDHQLFLVDILSSVPRMGSSGAFSELFDKKGWPRPLCPYCRKPFAPEKPGFVLYVAPFFCPHCGSVQRRVCPECDLKCDLVALFCPRCGKSLGEWQCDHCKGAAVKWMSNRPPLPPAGSFCIRCGVEMPAEGKDSETSIPPVRAIWYSGVLQIPCGNCLRYVHMGYMSVYEEDMLLYVEGGRVIKQETRKNVVKKCPEKP